jgi:hypothetical protein
MLLLKIKCLVICMYKAMNYTLQEAHKCSVHLWSLGDYLQLRRFSVKSRNKIKANVRCFIETCGRYTYSVWIRKTNKMSLFVFFISLLIVAQHVSCNHVPIIRIWLLRDVIALCWYVPLLQEGGQDRLAIDDTFCILYFSSNSCSTCFGQPCAHHQELTTVW